MRRFIQVSTKSVYSCLWLRSFLVKARNDSNESIIVASLVLFSLVFFFRTVFQGKPISKLCRLANWDSVFQQYSNASSGSCDPSLVQLLLPNYFLVAKLWHSFTLPLWNPYSGCGMPLVGDVQASVFGPIHIGLALSPSVRAYNLTLVAEVVICVLGTYALARLLTIKPVPAAFSSLCYSFCPYTLYYLELLSGTSQALLPLLLAGFVCASRIGGTLPLLTAALLTAAFVLSGHPESSFYGVVCGVILFAIAACFTSTQARARPVCQRVFELVAIAGLSLALTAPMLLPFIEYLVCGDSYKYGDGGAAFAPWPGLVLNLLSPCYGPASPFLGAIAVVVLPASFFVERKLRLLVIALWLVAIAALLLISRVGLFDSLLSVRPLSYLITVYMIPLFLLFLSLISALGLQSIGDCTKVNQLVSLTAITSVLLPLSLLACSVNLHGFNFDETLADMQFDFAAILLSAFLLGIFGLLLYGLRSRRFNRCGRTKVSQFRASRLIVVAGLFLNTIGLSAAARTALTVQPHFDLPNTELTDFLVKHPGRVLSVVEHVLKPNANIVYGISSLRVHNPIQPARFAEFAQLCGAKLDEFRNQSYSSVTTLIDLASVKYLVGHFKPVPSRYRLIYTTSEGINVYENPASLPEAYFVSSCLNAQSKAEAKAIISASSFDPRRQVVFENALAAPQFRHLSSINEALSPLQLERRSGNELVINSISPVAGCVVLTDTFYPGWQATVDGQETTIFRANFLFRGVFVPAGEHVVRFTYRPWSFVLGVVLAVCAWGIVLFLVLRLIFRPKS